jgi:predicted pyridoxine 5'-phosphate oxidase superfamily flavin-nucleotide-binding protein
MAALTGRMKDAIARSAVFPFATASPDGRPNVVPVSCLHVATDDTLWIADN